MEALRFIKIIFIFSISLLVIFYLISCRNPNEKLNVLITNDNGIGIYMWIGSASFPINDNQRFDIKTSDIDGDFPHYAFNNDELVGKLTIVNNNVITISFAKLLPPYLNIQNVTCNKTQ